MARINANVSLTLDGVMQGVGRPDEDTRGGFQHGGWGNGYQDEESMKAAGEGMADTTAMLFGHRTYDDLMTVWSAMDPASNPFTDYLRQIPKYVATRNPEATFDFPNSTALVGEASQTVADLKDRLDGSISILGSGQLVRSLHAAGLIDVYSLSIHPIVLGSGTKLFDDGDRVNLRLESAKPTSTGVVLTTHAPAS